MIVAGADPAYGATGSFSSLKWDNRFLDLAEHVSKWSKDPSTQVGAVIVRPDNTIVSLGYNGFPRGVNDSPQNLHNREHKYPRVVHAEVNAILMAKEPLANCTLYVTPLSPCSSCAGVIIQSGIRRVAFRSAYIGTEKWNASFAISAEMFEQAGVIWKRYDVD